MKRVLLVTLHFPPWAASSGYLRILSFCRHLPSLGWEPIVLTAHPRVYEPSTMEKESELPNGVVVYRAFGLDARTHLSIGGKYPSWLALPDRWSSWWLGGVCTGVRAMRRHSPHVILSTYPVTTAHLIGHTLSRLFRIPWVADFRDPIISSRASKDTVERSVRRWVERRTMRRCDAALFTTPGAREEYARRYPDRAASRYFVVPNGYDEAVFSDIESHASAPRGAARAPATILHSGTLYPDLRDPSTLFRALSELKRDGRIDGARLQLVFRAAGQDPCYRRAAADADVLDVVRFEPTLPYREALREMLTVDGLLLMQGAAANHQIPAKVYEYFRAGRPILALTDGAGDTAKLLHEAKLESVAQIDDVGGIKSTLLAFLETLEAGTWQPPPRELVSSFSRAEGARRLARVLDDVE